MSFGKIYLVQSDEISQSRALASLATLIDFMDEETVVTYRYAILNILRTTLKLHTPGLKKLSCKAFSALIEK